MTRQLTPFRLSYTDNTEVTVGERLSAEIAREAHRLWIASGYFGTSAWGAAGSALEAVAEFRLLIGKDHQLANLEAGSEERRIADLVRQALTDETQPPRLATRDEAENVAAFIAFIERHRERGEPVIKLWTGEGFLHAKAYILARSVGIGSANFTYAGLMLNRELVGWRQDDAVVAEVGGWFERYWEDEQAVDYTEELLTILRATPLVSEEYTPYELMIRTLAARYGTDRPPSLEQVSFSLKWFQEDAVFRLIRLLNGPARGALLADAVGLGKTFMGMGVIHHFLYTEAETRRGRGKPVLLVVPHSLLKMWTKRLRDNGLEWACELISLQSLRSEFDVRPYLGADLIVIDEAHRLRGGGMWFEKAIDLVRGGDRSDRRVLLMTATPLNTGIDDLINQLRVLTKNQRGVWAPEVADFERHLQRVERGQADPFPVLDRSIVRRSRSDILRAQEEARAAGVAVDEVSLPTRRLAHVDHGYGGDADLFAVFGETLRGLELAPYDLERFARVEPDDPGPQRLHDVDGRSFDADGDELAIRPGTLAALVAVGLLVRFQSSLEAIRISLRRLDAVLRRFDDALSSEPARVLDLRSDRDVHRLLAHEARQDEDAQGGEVDPDALDAAWARVLDRAPSFDMAGHHVQQIRESVARDRERIARLIAALPSRQDDGKVAALVAALKRSGADVAGQPALLDRRALLFTQFRDTAIYLEERLRSAFRVARIDGSVGGDQRASITAWFDPERYGERQAEADPAGDHRPDVLISTDVLAEGHNLQLADTVINFDLHFNPQVAVQRSGRVDRLGSPHEYVWLVSFMPPESLDRHIGLLARLDERFRRIHGLGLGDEQVTMIGGDRPGQTLEQMRRLYQRDDASALDEVERSWTLGSTDYMRQPLEAFLQRAGREQVDRIPYGVSSVKRLPADWSHGPGIFIAFAGPANRDGQRESYWRFHPRSASELWGQVISDEVGIFRAIACRENEPRLPDPAPTPGPTVIDWELLREAAGRLAAELTEQRAMAQLVAGASERSRRLRNELRAGLAGLDVEGTEPLLERLLQVRVEDYDGRSGWRRFDDARRSVRRARATGERREAAIVLVPAGLELFGHPETQADTTALRPVVQPEELRLISYEVLVES